MQPTIRNNDNAITQIEQALQVVLPETYKEVLSRYPFTPDSSINEYDFYSAPTWIIEANRDYRSAGFFGQDWPQHYLIIGADGSGNVYFLDLRRDPSPVFLADHENTAVSDRLIAIEEAPSLAAWIDQLQQAEAEWLAEEQACAERKKHKKWWQFWL